jgi:hypothetical protein
MKSHFYKEAVAFFKRSCSMVDCHIEDLMIGPLIKQTSSSGKAVKCVK